MKTRVSFFALLLVGMIIPLTLAPSPASGEPEAAPTLPSVGFSGLYEEVSVALPEIYQGFDYSLPVDISKVQILSFFNINDNQKEVLSRNGFVVAPAQWKEFYQIYEQAMYDYGENHTSDVPVFVTTDSIFHTYHLIFDKALRVLERREFEPAIRSLTAAMLTEAQEQYEQAKGTLLEDAAYRALAYFAVAQQLIEEEPKPPIPIVVDDLVRQELALIDAHMGIALSPLLSIEGNEKQQYLEDYSQYVPRGHYTRSEQLKRYFRAMMWYGRINLRLKSPLETRMALLITHLLRNTLVADGTSAMDVWAKVYDPTTFFVGRSDDLGIYDYGPIIDEIFGTSTQPAKFGDDELVHAFMKRVEKMPPPLINSMVIGIGEDREEATTGFRFMGQRFVLDAYIFNQLVMRFVEDRWLPKGLDVFAAMGNEEAYNLLDEMGETKYPGYDEQLEKLRGIIEPLGIDMWTQNLYWDWLYSLQAIASPKGDIYPPFMRTESWAHKDLHTALGSWTELKHDTILYAKQSMAEGGGDEVPLVRGYVEPNPAAYARLQALTQMTHKGLEKYNIHLEAIEDPLEDLEDMIAFLKRMAESELSGADIAETDYRRLQWYGSWLEWKLRQAEDTDSYDWPGNARQDDQAALIADVASESGGTQLEEAIGRVFEIYVVVPDGLGGLQLAVGGVYSYYEFPWPMSDRLTDEKWHEMIEEGKLPDRPGWTKSFIVE